MARNQTAGTKQLGVELDETLAEEWRAFVKARGETMREAVEMALRRHMAYPPAPPTPPPVEPLPDGAKPAGKRPKK